MKFISFQNAEAQSTEINLDGYEVTISLKDIGKRKNSVSVVMDISIDGFPDIYGIPLLPYRDLFESYINSGCMPVDFGAIIVMPIDNSEINVQNIGEGRVGIAYMNTAEVLVSSIYENTLRKYL